MRNLYAIFTHNPQIHKINLLYGGVSPSLNALRRGRRPLRFCEPLFSDSRSTGNTQNQWGACALPSNSLKS